jgi:hypothetical protein
MLSERKWLRMMSRASPQYSLGAVSQWKHDQRSLYWGRYSLVWKVGLPHLAKYGMLGYSVTFADFVDGVGATHRLALPFGGTVGHALVVPLPQPQHRRGIDCQLASKGYAQPQLPLGAIGGGRGAGGQRRSAARVGSVYPYPHCNGCKKCLRTLNAG